MTILVNPVKISGALLYGALLYFSFENALSLLLAFVAFGLFFYIITSVDNNRWLLFGCISAHL
jgi:apolipoprotein N-acyltransferase